MHLIFDFDGTLVDSFSALIKKYNAFAEKSHFNLVKAAEINDLKNLSSRELIKHLGIPLFKLPQVLYKLRKSIRDEITLLPSFNGMLETLAKLSAMGFTMGIVSSNSEYNVMSWLGHHNIQQYFNFIHIESNFFGKKRVLQKVLKLKNIHVHKVGYIGDETRDIEAANQCGIYSIAVTWGFNAEKILCHYHPDYVAHVPEDLLQIGLEINK